MIDFTSLPQDEIRALILVNIAESIKTRKIIAGEKNINDRDCIDEAVLALSKGQDCLAKDHANLFQMFR
ncbi:MAG: hypothetical protein WC156_14620 [Pedobacter sp.]